MRMLLASVLILLSTGTVSAAVFDGVSDHGTAAHGYYYAITGGKFPTGPKPNGDNGSGGTFRFIADDSVIWGRSASESGVWQKDDWFPENAGLALTLKNNGFTVYDNNGIEDGTHGSYYDATNNASDAATPGLYRGYSMSNNFDWIYAGYFKLEAETTITELIGYFDENSGFDRNSSLIGFRMNIWSNVLGNLLPTNTGSFNGDVFSSDSYAGTFSTSDTGVDRIFKDGTTDDIFRLTYSLDTPLVLGPGEYWFSHDAVITPEPASMLVWAGLGLCVAGGRRWRKRRLAS